MRKTIIFAEIVFSSSENDLLTSESENGVTKLHENSDALELVIDMVININMQYTVVKDILVIL